ncbi:MAG: ROK family protein [Candidatus Binatus sp.]
MPGKVWIGVDIGGTKTAVVVSKRLPDIIERLQFATLPAKGPDRALDLIVRGIGALLKRRGLYSSAIRAIGVSCGGPLDRVHGIIQSPPNLATWDDVPVKAILERRFGVRCNVENDANAGAVAEHRYGAGRGVENMVFLTMGTGLGAGIIVDGRLYRGIDDLAGEIGHVRLTRGGPVGYHKRGSVEGWASGGGMAQVAMRAVADARKRGRKTILTSHRATLTVRDVCAAAKRGDVLAMRIVRTTGERLGQVLAMLVDILNPQRIVIGGIAMRIGEMILGPARDVMMREALPASAASCRVAPAALGKRIGDVAALCVAVGL